MLVLLGKLDQRIEETPPLQTPQRFGNLAFRTWGKRLEEVGWHFNIHPLYYHCGPGRPI